MHEETSGPAPDEDRIDRERLARTRQALREFPLPATLLFDPLNARYAMTPRPHPAIRPSTIAAFDSSIRFDPSCDMSWIFLREGVEGDVGGLGGAGGARGHALTPRRLV